MKYRKITPDEAFKMHEIADFIDDMETGVYAVNFFDGSERVNCQIKADNLIELYPECVDEMFKDVEKKFHENMGGTNSEKIEGDVIGDGLHFNWYDKRRQIGFTSVMSDAEEVRRMYTILSYKKGVI